MQYIYKWLSVPVRKITRAIKRIKALLLRKFVQFTIFVPLCYLLSGLISISMPYALTKDNKLTYLRKVSIKSERFWALRVLMYSWYVWIKSWLVQRVF